MHTMPHNRRTANRRSHHDNLWWIEHLLERSPSRTRFFGDLAQSSAHSSTKMRLNLCLKIGKAYAKYIFALIFGLCSLWLVWDHCFKFFGGSTTILREQHHKDFLPLPKFLLCLKERYKNGVLSAMDLPEDLFSSRYLDEGNFNQKDKFPDLNATWQRATWPIEELNVEWSKYQGMQS